MKFRVLKKTSKGHPPVFVPQFRPWWSPVFFSWRNKMKDKLFIVRYPTRKAAEFHLDKRAPFTVEVKYPYALKQNPKGFK